MLRVLCIGDPHFKKDNAMETDMMTQQLESLIPTLDLDFVVILGDLLHRHEKVDLFPLKRATEFLRVIKSVSKHMYVLIGNHDRPNNRDFQSNNHSFTFLKEWEDSTVIEATKLIPITGRDGKEYSFAMCPYVPTGRLEEALKTAELVPPYEGISTIFAHQEFKGAKMNAITSNEGDIWDESYPLCISGHIHDFDQLQDNLVYPGTPIQHGYRDTTSKSISLLEYEECKEDGCLQISNHKRIYLRIPKKICVTLTPLELSTYELPLNSIVKIKVRGVASEIRRVMKLPHVTHLISLGVKIVEMNTAPLQLDKILTLNKGVRISFVQRLADAIQSETKEIQIVYTHIMRT